MTTQTSSATDWRRHWPLATHALLFTAAVTLVALAALGKARSYDPQVDQAVLNGRMAHEFERHYDQAFPARTFGIALWAALQYRLLGEAQAGAVLGRNDWLYTDEEFLIGNDASATVARNLARVAEVRDRLAAQHIALVVALVPAKARVYAEQLDRRKPPVLHRELYADAHAALQQAGIAAPDLLTPLRQGKGRAPTFLRTDTHWTAHGAGLAAQTLAGAVREALPAPAVPKTYLAVGEAAREHRGDLLNFLPLDPYFSSLLPPAEEIVPMHVEAQGEGDLFGEAAAPRIALIGTSYSANTHWNFAGALQQALGEDIANYARDGRGPYTPMFDYLAGEDFRRSPPALVIWELPERYLVAEASSAAAATTAQH